MRPNQWTMKYRSNWTTTRIRWLTVLAQNINQNIRLIHEKGKEMWAKITGSWNIGYCDLLLDWRQTFGHPESLSQAVMFLYI